jgi:integrase
VSELAGLTHEHIDWQNHRLMIYGKGGIYGTKSKRRIIPLTDRIRPLIDGHFAIHDTVGMTPRTIQRLLKRIANKARINRPVSPACAQTHLCRCSRAERYLASCPATALEDVIREFKEKW